MRPGDVERETGNGHGLGRNVFVVGSVPALANWNTTIAIALSSASHPVWHATANVPPNTAFQYKYQEAGLDGHLRRDPNRGRTTPTSPCAVTYTDTWR